MAKFLDKVMGFMGFEEDDFGEDEKNKDGAEPVVNHGRAAKGAVVSLHTQRQVRVVVMEVRAFDDVQGVADNLKNHRAVIVNLEQLEPELAKRVVDFVSGATYALNGNMQKVGNSIFLFAPSNVDIANELKEAVKERNLFPWLKAKEG